MLKTVVEYVWKKGHEGAGKFLKSPEFIFFKTVTTLS